MPGSHDPRSAPGMYVTRSHFAPGAGSRPHYHDQDRYITVIKGTWWVALGPDADVYDRDKMTPLKAGSFVVHPAFGHHFDGAKDEEAIVQIMGMGPVKSVQLNAPAGMAAATGAAVAAGTARAAGGFPFCSGSRSTSAKLLCSKTAGPAARGASAATWAPESLVTSTSSACSA